MKTSYLLTVTLTLLLTTFGFAQEPPAGAANPPTSYAAAQTVSGGPAMANFDAAFEENNVGFLHVYAIDEVDPLADNVLVGTEMSGTEMAVLPKKFQRMAERKNAKMYAAAAIRGIDEAMYLTRMDGDGYDRIDMFAIRGTTIRHLKTLAIRDCRGNRCYQLNSWITDIDGDTNFELMQMTEKPNGRSKKAVFVLDDQRKWAKTTELDAPWDSAEMK